MKLENGCLQVVGLLPLQTTSNACDLLQQYRMAPKDLSIGKGRTGKNSPHIRFANADTDEKLVAFVRQFGPVVAKSVHSNFERPREGMPERSWPPRLTAEQDMNELRSERLLYRSALNLVIALGQPVQSARLIQHCIKEIADKVSDWPRQWKREQRLRQTSQIFWKINPESVERIRRLSVVTQPDPFLPSSLDGRIVICELLNAFREVVFPNLLEFHSSIRYGIRPLLYSILRRELLYPRDIAACANTQCREFFEIERAGQRFCCDACSIQQRQREYWKRRGKKLREKRRHQKESASRAVEHYEQRQRSSEALRSNRRTAGHAPS